MTGADGAVLDCNDAYRMLAGIAEGEVPPPPELALAQRPVRRVLYRLARSAAEGDAREENLGSNPASNLPQPFAR